MKTDSRSTIASGQLLDSPGTGNNVELISYALREILAALGLPERMSSFEVLAQDLSRLAGKEPAWTKKYIHSVFHQRIEPSPMLARTIEALAQQIDGTPAGVAGSVWVKVLAQPDVPEGVLIPRTARVVKCARPGCPVWFVKVHPRQMYHDRECGRK
jgi:hypothetical protein